MNTSLPKLLFFLGLILFGQYPVAAEDAVAMSFDGVELREVLETVTAITGQHYFYGGPEGRDLGRLKIYFTSPDPIPATSVDSVFETLLNLHDLSRVHWGDNDSSRVQIVPSRRMGSLLTEFVTREQLDDLRASGKNVTLIYRLEHFDDGLRIHQQLRSFASSKTKNLQVLGMEGEPFLVIAGDAADVYRLFKTVEAMDVVRTLPEVTVLELRYLDARNAAKILRSLYSDSGAHIESSPGSSSLIVSAGKEALSDIRRVLAELDIKPTTPVTPSRKDLTRLFFDLEIDEGEALLDDLRSILHSRKIIDGSG